MKNLIITAVITLAAFAAQAQKIQTIKIHTSAECNECEIRLEEELNYTKGVKFAELDIPSMDLTVKYDTKKISPEKIREIISKLGYDADAVKADPKAQSELPECCQPGGMHRKGESEGEKH